MESAARVILFEATTEKDGVVETGGNRTSENAEEVEEGGKTLRGSVLEGPTRGKRSRSKYTRGTA